MVRHLACRATLAVALQARWRTCHPHHTLTLMGRSLPPSGPASAIRSGSGMLGNPNSSLPDMFQR